MCEDLLDTPEVDESKKNRYFVIKCPSRDAIGESIARSTWSTNVYNNDRLNISFRDVENVILICSIVGSRAFQGYATMRTDVKRFRIDWGGPNRPTGGVFGVQWERVCDVSFDSTRNLVNTRVQDSRDCQEIEPRVGAELIRLFDDHQKEPKIARVATEFIEASIDAARRAEIRRRQEKKNRKRPREDERIMHARHQWAVAMRQWEEWNMWYW